MKASITITCRHEHTPLFAALLGKGARVEPIQILGHTSEVSHPKAFTPGEFTLPSDLPCHGYTGLADNCQPREFAYHPKTQTLTVISLNDTGDYVIPCPGGKPDKAAAALVRRHLQNLRRVKILLDNQLPRIVLS